MAPSLGGGAKSCGFGGVVFQGEDKAGKSWRLAGASLCVAANNEVTSLGRNDNPECSLNSGGPAFASVIERVAVDRSGGSVEVILTTLERPCLARRCFRDAELIGAIGHDWQSLDLFHLHLLACRAMKSAVLAPEA